MLRQVQELGILTHVTPVTKPPLPNEKPIFVSHPRHKPAGCASNRIVTADRAAGTNALARLKTLSWLEPAQLERLAANSALDRIKRHATIFYEGETSSRVYVLLSGVAKLSFLNGSERVLVSLVGPGEVFGVSSLLPHSTRPFRCDAFSDCTVAVIRPDVFIDTVLGVPLDTLSRTLEVTVGRWWSMLLRYANFVGLGLRERLAGALLELASKFGARDSRGTVLTLKLTHADLAELVGASRQRTTGQLSEFEREHAIIRDGRRFIIVPEKLWELVQPPAPAHREGSASDGSRQVHHGKRP
jgi:CRP/FNR family transcriptional regulator, cyclic AMP receptor protein